MTANSFTGEVNTDNQFETVESVATGFTFTVGKVYTMQIQNSAYFKVSDAEFYLSDEKFQYKAGTDDLYIKTDTRGGVLTILEDEEEE